MEYPSKCHVTAGDGYPASLQGSHVLLHTFSSEQNGHLETGAQINDRQDGKLVLVKLAKHLRGMV